MKKITKSDLRGLTEMFPVYDEDAMRKIKGGDTLSDLTDFLQGQGGYSFFDDKQDFLWFNSYDSFFSSYSAYQYYGYVNFNNPGYFFLYDGDGEYHRYYNSVYGFGDGNVTPTTNLCFFNTLSAILGISVSTIFNDFKAMGYAYNPTTGVYSADIDSYLKAKGYGKSINFASLDSSLASGKEVMADLYTSYTDPKKSEGHQVILTGNTKQMQGSTWYEYQDPSNSNYKDYAPFSDSNCGLSMVDLFEVKKGSSY